MGFTYSSELMRRGTFIIQKFETQKKKFLPRGFRISFYPCGYDEKLHLQSTKTILSRYIVFFQKKNIFVLSFGNAGLSREEGSFLWRREGVIRLIQFQKVICFFPIRPPSFRKKRKFPNRKSGHIKYY